MDESLLSVGIDVGTSTTQLIASRLKVVNRAGAFSVPELEIGQREILYQSPIHFTPLRSDTELDAEGIREIVAREYRRAKLQPEQVATGAIIITGETARKENARAVLDSLKEFAGRFVVATAGPDLESVLAARGAGAERFSRQTGKTVVHMDIGGGTSNLALIEDGRITQTACLNVGGRLIRLEKGIVQWVSPVREGLCSLRPGCRAGETELEPVVARLVQALEVAVGLRQGQIPESLLTNRTLRLPTEPLTLSFSGGVADLIDSQPDSLFAYGDIGPMLGRAIGASRLCRGDYILGDETIRATVIGAGCYSTQLSGSTVYARDVALPLQNLPVLALTDREQGDTAEQLSHRLADLGRLWEEGPKAVYLPGLRSPGFEAVAELAQRLSQALRVLPEPHVVVSGTDMAKALGQALATRMPGPLLCLDSLGLTPESFLDVGAPVSGGAAYPVVKKTLILA